MLPNNNLSTNVVFLAQSGGAVAPQAPQTLQQVDSWLKNDLASYANWGTTVGVGMFACVMCATLIGLVIRNL
jgi:hypothetical protein